MARRRKPNRPRPRPSRPQSSAPLWRAEGAAAENATEEFVIREGEPRRVTHRQSLWSRATIWREGSAIFVRPWADQGRGGATGHMTFHDDQGGRDAMRRPGPWDRPATPPPPAQRPRPSTLLSERRWTSRLSVIASVLIVA